MNSDILKQRAKAFDYLFDSVVVTDAQGIISDWNQGSEALYGYSKAEAIGKPVNILHVPEDSEHITEQVMSAVASAGKWTGEIRMLHKDGSMGWIESMCVPIYDSNDQMIGALGVNREITDRVNKAQHLEHIANHDHLTKIPNRYLLFDRVEHLIAKSERNKNSFALLYIDLDKFKLINDTRGHSFGDQVLIETAKRLKQSIRNSDTVARIGGDEFVILLEDISGRADVSIVFEKLEDEFNRPLNIEDESIELGSSIGAAIYPDEGKTMDALLAAADKKMYATKYASKREGEH